MDTRIYVITHKKYREQTDPLYRTLHVGRAISSDLGYEGDDTGDSISEKNKQYCELTGLYWIWKNVSCDIVGICHYRRYFIKDHAVLSKEFIERTLKDYDAISVRSGIIEYPTVREQYSNYHHEKDLLTCRDVIAEKYPDYIPAFDLCINCCLFSLANMIILRKDLFDEYCAWVFDILFEVERRTDTSDYTDYQKRLYGFLSERLMRIWLLNHKLRIYESMYEKTDDEAYYEKRKEIESKQRLTQLLLNDLTLLYRKGNYIDLADNHPNPIDFGGKIPVWVCWWQGEDDMPDIVRLCIQSIKNNLPDNTCLHMITMENFSDYVSFPEIIISRFEAGQITLTHLSDILRMGLLYRYGGLWLDATYFVTKPIPASFFEQEFFTQKMPGPIWWHDDVTQGRWANNLLYGSAGNPYFQYMLNAFYLYWDARDSMIDYYLIDYIASIAYENIPKIHDMISAVPVSNPQIQNLRRMLNEPFNRAGYEEAVRETTFCKFNRNDQLLLKTPLGGDTLFQYLCDTTL